MESDVQLSAVVSSDFDALVIPGGTVNADTLRQDAAALKLINDFVKAGKTIAAICHGPWTLIDAG
ncbi:DJ-1/PfpI family protein, partial [Klebsiella pneumoniae]|uniref:DJ-1/PfpI family protein n=1 Tax=Klebsiella pneumoniae TaxID=573 RepID=UPI002AE00CD0